MSTPRVSVIVPTYNRVDCLLTTLECVRAQTCEDWELILVDDGSTDDTAAMVARQFEGDSRLRYIFQANGGVSNARNTGLKAASGEFIAFLDSDDCWKPWKLEAQLACMALYPDVGMVWTDMETIDDAGTVLERRHLRSMYSAFQYHTMASLFRECVSAADIPAMPPEATVQEAPVCFYFGDIYASMILGSLVHTSTVLLRRERALQVGGFDESLRHSGEDYDFHLRTCAAGPVGLLDVSSIQYRKGREDRLTRHTGATAMNFLATVQKAALADNGGRFRRQDVRLSLMNAHAWVAEENFKRGDARGLRQHALRSLRMNVKQPRLFLLIIISYLPHPFVERLTLTFRALKAWAQRQRTKSSL